MSRPSRMLAPGLARILVLTLVLATLAGCALSRTLREVPVTLLLQVPSTAAAGLDASTAVPARSWQLQVEAVQADPLRGGARVLRRAGAELGAYQGVAWVEPASELWQRLLVTGLAGALPGATRAGSPLRSDCRLLPELLAFEVDADGERAEIRIALVLVHAGTGRLLGRQAFNAFRPVTGRGATALVDAYQAALTDLWPGLMKWVLATGDAGCGQRPAD